MSGIYSNYLVDDQKAERKAKLIFGLIGLVVVGLIVSFFVFRPAAEVKPVDLTPLEGVDNYALYSQGSIEALPPEDNNVLFFSAEWCVYCPQIENDLVDHKSEYPENLNIIKIDVDKETELAQKYKVQGPPTMIKLDADKNGIKTFQALTLTEILAQTQQS